ncbi:hypothetical protein KIW84_057273 [Lathyrus oleraceus]|uniref:poly(A)-specific ribonuclease n=1 Tax=Pisum sativum TaxID=3888 RepID=A0A9D4X5F9_PEA|nr:hypothetical protein KIW84_057272 [Pisum sativum]KAI5412546.1 hypothetical protein KIW84_057273 [Pisum sativum]
MNKLKGDEQSNNNVIVRQVWAYNLENEFLLIRGILHEFHFISMDTEFPGVIYESKEDSTVPYHLRRRDPLNDYNYLKANVDNLKLIQLGLTLSDSEGNLPDFGTKNKYIWEFNFSDFDIENDPHNQDSTDMLSHGGIDFKRNFYYGVNSLRFSELMIRSGLVFNNSVIWVTFHGAYDFGYLMKILMRRNLPNTLERFLFHLKVIFRNIYDLKHVVHHCKDLYGGLNKIANTLDVNRVVGKSHQAGSDSLLTLHVFMKMKVIFIFQDMSEIVNNGVQTLEANADDAQQAAHKEQRKRMKVIFRFQDMSEIVNNGVQTLEANADDAQQAAHKEQRKRMKKVCF